jgi:hypothetical protein
MIPLKKLAIGFAALTAFTLPAMAQYGPSGHGYHNRGAGTAVIYQHADFRGQSLRVTGPIAHLSEYRFNDKASSIRIHSGSWEVCVDPNFRGRCEILTYREDQLNEFRLNDKISSIRPVADRWGRNARRYDRGGRYDRDNRYDRRRDLDRGQRGHGNAPMILFADPQYRGSALPVNGAIPPLNQLRFNDTVSSIVINSGVWEVCTDPNFRGRCEIIDRSVDETGYYRLNDNITSVRPAGYSRRPGYNRPF